MLTFIKDGNATELVGLYGIAPRSTDPAACLKLSCDVEAR